MELRTTTKPTGPDHLNVSKTAMATGEVVVPNEPANEGNEGDSNEGSASSTFGEVLPPVVSTSVV